MFSKKEKDKLLTVLGRTGPTSPGLHRNTGTLTTGQSVLQISPYRFKNQKRSPPLMLMCH
jgi:hypothetical protein